MTRLTIATSSRTSAETLVPMTVPTRWSPPVWCCRYAEPAATPMQRNKTTLEWPSEKYSPTLSDGRRSAMSLRLTLSIAAM
eukprot:1127395-Prymnesium_polylepis.2